MNGNKDDWMPADTARHYGNSEVLGILTHGKEGTTKSPNLRNKWVHRLLGTLPQPFVDCIKCNEKVVVFS